MEQTDGVVQKVPDTHKQSQQCSYWHIQVSTNVLCYVGGQTVTSIVSIEQSAVVVLIPTTGRPG